MRFQIKVLRRADRDVDRILWWFSNQQKSPSGAATWFRSYEAALQRLSEFADSQSLSPESEYATHDVRHALFKTRRGRVYRILFTIVGDEARVLHVRGPGQNLVSVDQHRSPDEE